MSIIAGLLTFVLVLDCAFLVLLVLLQLPKKEAGAGTAFGGGATDVLFGAGTGNVLTKATSYSAGIFLGLCLILAIMNNHMHSAEGQNLKKALATPGTPTTPAKAVTPVTNAPAAKAPTATSTKPQDASSTTFSESPTVPQDKPAPLSSETPTAPQDKPAPLSSETPTAPQDKPGPTNPESPTVPN